MVTNLGKRFLAFFMALIMLFSVVPTQAFAAEDTHDHDHEIVEENEALEEGSEQESLVDELRSRIADFIDMYELTPDMPDFILAEVFINLSGEEVETCWHEMETLMLMAEDLTTEEADAFLAETNTELVNRFYDVVMRLNSPALLADTTISDCIAVGGITVADDVLTLTATGKDGSCGSSNSSGYSTATITNNAKYPVELSFAWEVSGGTVTVKGTAPSESPYSIVLSAGEKIEVKVTTSGTGSSATATLTMRDFAVSGTVTFGAASDGTYTVGGEVATAGIAKTDAYGTTYELSATAAEGYSFVGWFVNDSETPISTDAAYTYTNAGNVTVTPKFGKDVVAIFADPQGPEGAAGSYTVNGQPAPTQISGGAGAQFTLVATATDPITTELDYWMVNGEQVHDREETITVKVDTDTTVYPVFRLLDVYTITTAVNDAEMGTVSATHDVYEYDDTSVTAAENEGALFLHWQDEAGNILATDKTYTYNPDKSETLTAVFRWLEVYTITTQSNDASMGTFTETQEVLEFNSATVTAAANTGFYFEGWYEADGVTLVTTDATYTYTPTESRTLTALFRALEVYTITTQINDPAMGSVSDTHDVYEFAETTVTATVNEGFFFMGWYGEDGETQLSADKSYTFTPTANTTLIAKFREAKRFNVSVTWDQALGSVAMENVTAEGIAYEGTTVKLTAAAASGSTFLGWTDANGKIYKTDAAISFALTESSTDISYKAVFAKDGGTPWFGVGSSSGKVTAEYLFDSWDAAMSVDGENNIVLMNNATLPAREEPYVVPSGKTFVVPRDAAGSYAEATPTCVESSNYATPYVFRTLTMVEGANITVNGNLNVSGVQCAGGTGTGAGVTNGAYGHIRMDSGSTITVNGSAKLYVWGYITGSGSVTIKSSGTVYEHFQAMDWRGGSCTSSMASANKAFPFSQYYVQNVEVPMRLEAGAVEWGYMSTTISYIGVQGAQVPFIGPDGMFQITSGYVIKDYNEQTDRLEIDSYGTIEMQSLSISMKLGILGSSTINTANFELPINSNISVRIHNVPESDVTNSITITQSIILLPGAEIVVDEGTECILDGGYNIYLFDQDDWSNYVGPSNYKIYPLKYAPGRAAGATNTAARGESSLVDAKLVVNGTVDASAGGFFTTNGGANVCSTGSGKIILTRIAGENSFLQVSQNDTTANYVDIPATSPQLRNADESVVTTALSEGSAKATYQYIDGVWTLVCNDNAHSYEGATCQNPGVCAVCGIAGTEVADHTDSETDNDHVCDYGCGLVMNDCSDASGDGNHNCDVCGKESITECADADTDHKCDECSVEMNMDKHVDAENDGDHLCDYGCKAVLSQCSDATGDGDHSCDECKAEDVSEHTYNNAEIYGAEITPADCTNAALHNEKCDECGEENTQLTQTVGTALGHDMAPATCQAPATCKRGCSYTEGEPAPHSFTEDSGVPKSENREANCTLSVTNKAKCANCPEISETEVFVVEPALDHDFVNGTADEVAKWGDCYTKNLHYAKCSRCDAVSNDEQYYIEGELNHAGEDIYVKDPTCTKPQTLVIFCDDCGATIGEETMDEPALGHAYGDAEFEWNISAEGVTATASITCGRETCLLTHEGHTLSGDAVVVENGKSEGDCKNPSTVTYTATVTLDEKEYSEDKVVEGELGNHSLELTAAQPETCGKPGNIAYNTCSVCGKFFKEDGTEIQKDEWIIPATGEHGDADGDGNHDCDTCGAENVTDHSYSDATCDVPKTCAECGTTDGEALGHIDADKDHKCDRNCGKTDIGEHTDSDKDHACDYGCKEAIGTCEDEDKDHKCDYGCDKAYGEHVDSDNDHACDYGCKEAIGTCEDTDYDHKCDYGCDKVYGEHADKTGDGDHKCDYCQEDNLTEHNWKDATCTAPKTCEECGAVEGDPLDHPFEEKWTSDQNGHWHKCSECEATTEAEPHNPGPEATETDDQVCLTCGYILKSATGHTTHTAADGWLYNDSEHWNKCTGCTTERLNVGTHEDADKDHKCDTCSAAMGVCEDKNLDHICDYEGCQVVYGTCEDKDLNHKCDYGCDKAYGEHVDSDNDHACDYGCKEAIGTCEDADYDHKCDYGCDKAYGEHADSDKDHACDYGCKEAIGICEDKDLNHKCDYGCDKAYGEHVDSDKDHACDYGCKEAIGTCEDLNKDHICDYGCDKAYGEHKDAADDKDHICDYCQSDEILEECSDAAGDGDHNCDVCGKEDVTDHAWVNATCNEPKTCSECALTEGNKLGHTYGEVVFAWAANGESATASVTCGVCDEHAKDHVLTENAVVTKIGSTSGDCQTKKTATYEAVVTINGGEYKDTKVVEGAVGSHNRVTNVVPATCDNGGYTERVCTICGNSIISNRTQALGHDMAPATCTVPSTCKNGCGKTEGEPAGHSFTTKASAKQASAASCTEKARYYAQCDNCTEISDTVTVEVGNLKAHTFEKQFASEIVATPATCTAAAKHYVLCDDCDYVNKEKTVVVGNPAPHSFGSVASSVLATEANCTEAATYYVRCDKCTAVSDEKTVAVGKANGHSYTTKQSDQLAAEANCTEAAKYYVQCDNCTEVTKSKTVSVGEPNGHSFTDKDSGVMVTPAACEAKAVHKVQCDNCTVISDDKTVEVGESLGHDMADATCELPATCKNGCGLTEGEALGHKMSEATCSAPSTCENGCGKTEGEKLPHTPVDVEEMPALCDEPGHKEGKICDVCGVTLSGMQIIPALGHQIVDVPAKKPTFGNPGWETYKRCINCNYTTYVEIPALPVPSITTYEQFIESLIELEKLTAEYIQLNPGKDPLGMMIEYIRTGVDRYNSGSWNIMAGYEDPDFAKFISQREDEINAQYDNVEDMIKVTALKDIHEFVLPNGDGVDFGHMFGTMDITYHNNFSENHADVAGWAGDLVDLLTTSDRHNVYTPDENGVYPTIEEMTKEIGEKYLNHDIAGEDDQFGHSDMYGDLDGFYLMNTLKKQGYESGDLAKIMQAYFTKDLTDEYRAEYFLKNRLDGVSTRNAVRDAVYSEYVSNKVISTLEGTRDFKAADVSQMRIACCYAFADYLCRLGGDYVEVPGNDYFTVFESEFSNLAPGITQEIKKATTADNKQIVYYIATADINRADVNVYANYNENDPSKGWKMSRVLDQAMAAQNRYGDPNSAEYIENYNVITSINADGFNMSTGEPGGVLVMLGTEYHPINSSGFFGILKNGKAVIGTMADYNAMKDQVAEAVGGFGTMLVDEGKIAVSRTDNYYSDRASRTAVGITRSGKVIFMVLDGRQEPVSCGGSMQEIAQIMLEAGCYYAINLDGGGSTTYVAKPEGENDLRVVSKPSDGFARSVSTSLMMVSTAPSSTAFDHAALESDYDYLTPNSKIHLTAKGVSATGNEAELPEGAYWAVDDTSKATITEDGELTGLALGAVNVNLMVGNTVIGSKQILVTNPDAIYFSRETLNVVFGSPTELPVKAQYQGKPIAINTADVKFSLSNDAAGTMEGFAFTAKAGSGLKVVKITAALTANESKTASISVSMFNQGEMSFDFEQATGGDRVIAWFRQVSNSTTDDNSIYEVVKLGEPMVTTYTFALDMSQISMPEQLEDLTYMLPGADAADASAWNFLLQLAERVSVLTEVKAEVRFDKNFDVDYSQMKIVCEYFVMNDPEKGIVYNEEENTLTLTLNWKDQTQAIDPETADPLVLLSGIKLTPKADAAWDAKDRLIPVHSGEISYHVFLRANALYTFASKEANQLEYGLMPFENKDVIIGGATEKGGSFKSVYATFNDTYTLINAVKNGWVGAEGGYMYYVDGVYYTGIQEVDGYWYDFGENGICIGQQKYNGLFVKDGKTHYARFGVLVKNDWMSVGDDRYRFDQNGDGLHGKVKVDEVELKFDNGKLIGGETGFIKKSDGKTYHYVDGVMTLGWYLEDGDWYHFDTGTGVMNTGTHVLPDAEAKSKNAYYDFAPDGKLICGYFNPSGYYYWPGLITGSEHAGTGLPKIDQWVQSGAVADDWPTNGATKDSWYRTNSHGHFVTGGKGNSSVFTYEVDGVKHNAIKIAINGVGYIFDNDAGYLLRGEFVLKNGSWYYIWLDEPVNDGWFQVDGKTFYAFEDGTLAIGSHVIDGKPYMFSSSQMYNDMVIAGALIEDGIRLYVEPNKDYTALTVSTSETKDLTKVQIAVWSEASGQSDMVWFDAEVNAKGEWIATVPLCLYKNTGKYQFHAWAVDQSGTNAVLVTTTSNVAAVAQHVAGEAYEANHVDPTCTVDGGYDMVVSCTACGTELSKEHHVIPAAHTPGEPVIENLQDAACVQGGSYDKVTYCSICGKELSRETVQIPAGTHAPGTAVKENVVEATCETDGSYEMVTYCISCNVELSREKTVVKAEGHKPGEAVVENETEATCEVDGGYDTVISCEVCKEELSREHTTLKATGHKPGEEVKENEIKGSCVADGRYELAVYCQTCEKELSREKVDIPAPGHQYTNDQDTTCNVCGEDRTVEIETTPMYRLYNPNSGEHFYTGSVEERENLVVAGWIYEGVAWNAPVKTGEPVYRLYNPVNPDHHYTMSAEERDNLVAAGWIYEGVAWNSASPSNLPQYRLYNPNALTGIHHYTGSIEERDNLVAVGWIYEGIGWYGMLK